MIYSVNCDLDIIINKSGDLAPQRRSRGDYAERMGALQNGFVSCVKDALQNILNSMEFKYENKWNFLLAIFVFGCSTYVLSGMLSAVLIVILTICIVYLISRNRRIVFNDNNVVVNNDLRPGKRFIALYSQVLDVRFDQIYVTTYVNIVVTINFDINDTRRKVKFDIDKYYRAGRLYKLLNDKNVKCRFSDDYIEMLVLRNSLEE